MLRSVDTLLQRCRPASRVDSGTTVVRTLDGLPVYQECDGVFRPGHAVVVSSCDTGSGTSHDTGGNGDILQDPATDVNVMRREIVAIAE